MTSTTKVIIGFAVGVAIGKALRMIEPVEDALFTIEEKITDLTTPAVLNLDELNNGDLS